LRGHVFGKSLSAMKRGVIGDEAKKEKRAGEKPDPQNRL
jgi:hypothetical protein